MDMADRLASWLERALERRRLMVLVLFSAALLLITALKARAKPFWHDEIYTIVFSGLPSIGAMWSAALDGLDLAPPLNALLTRVVHAIVGVGPIATRLPPMVGYWTMSMVVFSMVRRRTSTALALAALLLPCFTAAYRYSYEARGYGLMVRLFALSLNSWAEAAAGRRRAWHIPLLALTLTAGYWTHYFAVLALVPIGAGEVARLVHNRKPDWPVWAAIAASGVGALPLRALLVVATSQSAEFWERASLADVGGTYRFLFERMLGARFALAAAIMMLSIVATFLRRIATTVGRQTIPFHEIAAGLGCVLLPVAGVGAAMLTAGGYVPRYALTGVVGVSLAIPLALWWAGPRRALAEVVLCLVLTVSFAESVGRTLLPAAPARVDPVRERPLLARQLAQPGPTVLTGSVLFLQLWYYTPARLRGHMVYVADPAAALHYTGSDTIDRGYLVLRRWSAVNVQEFVPFVAAHPRFRVHAEGSGWLLDKLYDAGAVIEPEESERGRSVYNVALH
jgi:hypothetical protein